MAGNRYHISPEYLGISAVGDDHEAADEIESASSGP